MKKSKRLSVISFTENGRRLSEKLAEALKEDGEPEVRLFAKGRAETSRGRISARPVSGSLGDWAEEQMEEKNGLLFIGACGIAVRAIGPFLTDKLHDVPVLVMDEKGRYVIPILSGHFGGANELACKIGKKMGAEPVITTATDIHGKFAVDLFAKRNGFSIKNKEGIAKVSAKALAGEEIVISIDPGHGIVGHLPQEVRVIPYPPAEATDVIVSVKENGYGEAVLLEPKEYILGIGCRKGKGIGEIGGLIMKKTEELGIGPEQILALASVSQKCGEPGIVEWSRREGIPFFTYTAEELREVEGDFQKSSFVEEQVGVDNVCERAALRACGEGGKLVLSKYAENGMTIAVAKREWKVSFDEE